MRRDLDTESEAGVELDDLDPLELAEPAQVVLGLDRGRRTVGVVVRAAVPVVGAQRVAVAGPVRGRVPAHAFATSAGRLSAGRVRVRLRVGIGGAAALRLVVRAAVPRTRGSSPRSSTSRSSIVHRTSRRSSRRVPPPSSPPSPASPASPPSSLGSERHRLRYDTRLRSRAAVAVVGAARVTVAVAGARRTPTRVLARIATTATAVVTAAVARRAAHVVVVGAAVPVAGALFVAVAGPLRFRATASTRTARAFGAAVRSVICGDVQSSSVPR